MVSIPIAVVMAVVSLLCGAGVTWGALSNTVKQLNAVVSTLQTDVRSLNASVAQLSQDLAVMKARDEERERARRAGAD